MGGAQLGVALVSFAHSHGELWGEAFVAHPEARLVGAWDADADRGTAACARLGVPFTADLDALLEDPGVDAVAITSEHARHVAHVEAAAARGLPILCEKPLAVDHDGLARVRTAVEGHGVRFMQGFQMRLDPANQYVRDIVRDGRVGRVASVWKRHSHPYGLTGWPHGSGDWFFDPALAGGGAGMDELVHTCDWLRWMFGEPTTVVAASSSHMLGTAVEDNLAATFRLPGGALAILQSSWTEVGGLVTGQICGDAGTVLQLRTDLASVRSEDPIGAPVLVSGADERTWERPDVPHGFETGPHHRVAGEFVRCLREDVPFPSGLDDGARAVELVLAVYEAVAQGAEVACGPSSPNGRPPPRPYATPTKGG